MRYPMFLPNKGRESVVAKVHLPHGMAAVQYYAPGTVEHRILHDVARRPDLQAAFAAHCLPYARDPQAAAAAHHLGAMHGLALAAVCNMIYPMSTDALARRALNALYYAVTGAPLSLPEGKEGQLPDVVDDTREALEHGDPGRGVTRSTMN